MREIPLIIGMLLAVYGAADLLWRLTCYLLLPCRKDSFICPLCGEREDAEYIVRAARLRGIEPLLLDRGLSPEHSALTQEVCRRMGVTFLKEKEWQELPKMPLQDEKRGV